MTGNGNPADGFPGKGVSAGRQIARFALPCVVANLVDAVYNITDQIFIGHGVGIVGNAATNVAFPLVTACTALSLLIGVGAASNFSLELGRGNPHRAAKAAGNGLTLALTGGILLSLAVLLFLNPMLRLFGATEGLLPTASTYTGITALSIPFLIFKGVATQLIRADGSPAYAMACMIAGAVANIALDALFIFGLDMGMAGAAWATVAGQALSALLALAYLGRFRCVGLSAGNFRPAKGCVWAIFSLGAAASISQVAVTAVHIALNNTLAAFGAGSQYGSEMPLAVVGVVSKLNLLFMAVTIGISQGCQPIFGFNYGAGRYGVVKRTFLIAAAAVTLVTTAAFACYRLLPDQLLALFGDGGGEYLLFGRRYLSIYMSLMMFNGIHPLATNFFTSIGSAPKGILLALTRQVFLRLPLITLLPLYMGIEGVFYAGPLTDLGSLLLAAALVWTEFRRMGRS